ncbi:hypothetical protein HKX48_008881 [Thoreauomyces humboldtii]|nr:hypothetical protein HKX48_008881 [Thoreauomyces humboldtii]
MSKLADMEKEVQLLRAFQEVSLTSPTTLATQYTNAVALQSNLESHRAASIATIKAQDESDRRDMDNVFSSRIQAIIAASKEGIPPSVQRVLQESIQAHSRLNREIAMHVKVHAEMEKDIERRKARKQRARREVVADPRRKVLLNPQDMSVLKDLGPDNQPDFRSAVRSI